MVLDRTKKEFLVEPYKVMMECLMEPNKMRKETLAVPYMMATGYLWVFRKALGYCKALYRKEKGSLGVPYIETMEP